MVEHTYEVLDAVDDVSTSITHAETSQSGFLVTSEDSYAAPFSTAIAHAEAALDALAGLTIDNPNQQNRIAALRPLVQHKFDEMQSTTDTMRTSGSGPLERLCSQTWASLSATRSPS